MPQNGPVLRGVSPKRSGPAPSMLVVLGLEARPKVILNALHYEEELRLRAWLESSGLAELVDRALELAEESPAA